MPMNGGDDGVRQGEDGETPVSSSSAMGSMCGDSAGAMVFEELDFKQGDNLAKQGDDGVKQGDGGVKQGEDGEAPTSSSSAMRSMRGDSARAMVLDKLE